MTHFTHTDQRSSGDFELLLRDLIKHWRRTALWSIGLAILFTALSFLPRPTYMSRTAFMPEAPQQPTRQGGLLGFASQLGLGLSGSTASPQFYADLIRSTTVVDSVLATRVGTDSTIADYFVEGATPRSAAWEKARARLSASVSPSVNPRTNVIEVRVLMRDAGTARLIARRFLETLNVFNGSTRRTSAKARREFLGRSLSEAQDSLEAAEAELGRFLASNRAYESSPALRLAHARRERRVQRFQDNLTSLRTEYDVARLDEVNDQPLITVIDEPSLPVRPTPLHHVRYFALGLLAGVLGAMLGSLARVSLIRMLTTEPERFRALRRDFGRLPVLRGLLRQAESAVPAGTV